MAKIIVVTSGKGGVGKTTTSASFASALALRGRALAGVQGNHDARIFCTCLEPELISIAGIYRTTENPLPADVLGKPVQIWLEEEKLMIEPLRLT